MKAKQLISALTLVLFSFGAIAQLADTVQLPVIYAPQYSVYIAENGNDNNTGDSLNPLATFSEALNKLNAVTTGQTGELYAEVILLPGAYSFALAQPLNRYQIGSKKLNVSVRGVGEVILDGNGVSMSGGGGMVHLLGSHISVKNLKIIYSAANGVRFGYDYNGTVINPHAIWIDSVEVAQTGGHGIIVGIGETNTANPFALTPRAERFLISHCHVHDAVNFNTPQSQWGSAIKFHNVKHGTAINNLVHDNSGEGIDADYCDYIRISNNELYDNYANVYLDKAENCIISHNLIYNINKNKTGILMGIEPSTGIITDFFIRNIFIYNNVLLNTPGISVWQGTYSAIQNGYFSNINIEHNTIIGRQSGNGAPVSFSYFTNLGQPGANVIFSNLKISRNIISANIDSLNNGRLISAPLNPQPALTSEYNLYNMHPTIGYNIANDVIDSTLPQAVNPHQLGALIPHADSNAVFVMPVPNNAPYADDFLHRERFSGYTNAGAFELDTTIYFADTTITFITNTKKYNVIIYPNPFSKYFFLETNQIDLDNQHVSLSDLTGKKVSINIEKHNRCLKITTGNIPSGIYYCSITFNSEVVVLRIMKYDD